MRLLLWQDSEEYTPPEEIYRDRYNKKMSVPPQLGTTFSQRQAEWLDLDPHETFLHLLDWPLSVVRLGAYWDELESQARSYDFSSLEWYLRAAEKQEKEVLLTVGVKAPRWPEFYFPAHITPDIHNLETQASLLKFVEATVRTSKEFSCITAWQVENEPLDPSGPNNVAIPFEFLQQECALIRSLDKNARPLLINLWGNDLSLRGTFPEAEILGDMVGLDIYYKQFMTQVLGKNLYRGPLDSDMKLQKIIEHSSRPVWITELQAEPWEKDEAGYRSDNPQSFSLALLEENWQRAKALQCKKVLFWGAEYWLWQEKNGNREFIDWIYGTL